MVTSWQLNSYESYLSPCQLHSRMITLKRHSSNEWLHSKKQWLEQLFTAEELRDCKLTKLLQCPQQVLGDISFTTSNFFYNACHPVYAWYWPLLVIPLEPAQLADRIIEVHSFHNDSQAQATAISQLKEEIASFKQLVSTLSINTPQYF